MKLLFSWRLRRNTSNPSGFFSLRRIIVVAFFGIATIIEIPLYKKVI
jgi:hypothetical protein